MVSKGDLRLVPIGLCVGGAAMEGTPGGGATWLGGAETWWSGGDACSDVCGGDCVKSGLPLVQPLLCETLDLLFCVL